MPFTFRPPSRRTGLLVAFGLCATLTAVGLFSGRADAADPAPAPRPALTVATALPQAGSLPIALAANGSIAAWQEAVIGSQASGLRLTDVKVNVGDNVRAGQVLATFAAETPRAELAQARASLLEAQANAADAAANAERARTLDKSGALSSSQIAQYMTTEQTARARVEAAKAAYDAQQVRLGFTQVLAPDSGVISSRSATVGAVLGAGTELFRMVRRGRLEWRAEVTSAELGRIRPGQKVQIVAASGAEVEGTVRMLAPTVDPQTRNGLVYVDLPAQAGYGVPGEANATAIDQRQPPGRPKAARASPSGGGELHAARRSEEPGAPIYPGMFAKGVFNLGSSTALTVPQQAVVVREAFSYVFVPDADHRVVQRKVVTGRRVGDRIEIVSGLDAGKPVVVEGAGFLNDRDLVRIANEGAR
ncbi:efflux RND transporter periplasmic adaptor subunit [Xylophilus sp. GOD-11R]|uniref:efflux RND transporter periplasmic adaptor subunit n=1 Tax=Xylophilus sp. GOD-11R TaxID=3089814 RepID=UPI00298BEB58|nr:efflux RND transporter periplasmic adaptor subunit [Xylophilus sp. GOD-11R]WPB56852.1 efflux RND transporter periplasmic adaptor subunit [Xylophilus sp. GOD-11R]